MTQHRIFIDLDGVVADLLTGFAKIANDRFGTNVTAESFKWWDMSLAFPSIDKDEVFDVFNAPGLFANLKPIPGAIEAVKLLMSEPKFDVLFLSASTSRFSCSEKRGWVKRHFGYTAAGSLILTNRKDVIGQEDDWLIDDRPENVEKWKGQSILFDAPHNQHFHHWRRVKNWDEVFTHLPVKRIAI